MDFIVTSITKELCSYFILLLCLTSSSARERTVNSNVGQIKGSTLTVKFGQSAAEITTFLGIPFAEPPILERRFAKAIPKARFTQTFSALQFGASCPQYFNIPRFMPDVIDEDCLYLNVYTPDTTGDDTKVPVMMFIHGGGFVMGDGKSYGGERISAYGKVVVVTFNYRLGALGFINTNDGHVDANNGLYDQHLAIKWVHDNIESFGGDSSKVTIFGESAGSACVMYQALFPENTNLFHRVIAESGAINKAWALVSDPVAKAKKFAQNLNCPVTSSLDMVKCLRDLKNVTEMAVKSFLTFVQDGEFVWSPSDDGYFVTKERRTAMDVPIGKTDLSLFKNLDLIMGTNGYDGELFLTLPPFNTYYDILRNESTSIETIKETNKRIYKTVIDKLYGENKSNELVEAVSFLYTNYEDSLSRDLHIKQAVDFSTDIHFFATTHTTLANHAFNNTVSKTFQYEFDELYPFMPRDSWIKGALHADELPYVFGFPDGLRSFSGFTRENGTTQWPFSSKIIDYWTNFAKTGNPNEPISSNPKWNELTNSDRSYMYLTSSKIENRKNLYPRRAEFWTSYLPMLLKRIEDRLQPPTTDKSTCINSGFRKHVDISLIVLSILIFHNIEQ